MVAIVAKRKVEGLQSSNREMGFLVFDQALLCFGNIFTFKQSKYLEATARRSFEDYPLNEIFSPVKLFPILVPPDRVDWSVRVITAKR